jgi:hypothetical protein
MSLGGITSLERNNVGVAYRVSQLKEGLRLPRTWTHDG